jgi:hypothetical protein
MERAQEMYPDFGPAWFEKGKKINLRETEIGRGNGTEIFGI